jgi:2-iminobutanoate/2-iminopropanoate deaminase
MQRETLKSPPQGPRHGQGMVPGVKAGGLMFFSAIRGNDPQSRGWSDDTETQARQALDNLRALLEANGATLQHVVKVTLFLQKLEYRTAFHKVWMEYFPENPPARIAFEVGDANSNPNGNAHFALDVIAVAP